MNQKINPSMNEPPFAKPARPAGVAAAGEKRKESVFWIETNRIFPNPFQPRREFDDAALRELAESIREYGILQPIVVTRKEKETVSGRAVEYELLAGERRLRAAKMIGISQIPVIIRDEMSDKVKLELALVENLQREDLNAIERARAFKQLIDEFGMLQREVGEKVGKSREVVANTLRLLTLPDDMQVAVAGGKITEGHTRPLLMLADQPEKQRTLYSDILAKQLSVRDAELISRTIAKERARVVLDPNTRMLQDQLENRLGTRVSIEKKGQQGTISIKFFSEEELRAILNKITPVSENPLRDAGEPVLTPLVEHNEPALLPVQEHPLEIIGQSIDEIQAVPPQTI